MHAVNGEIGGNGSHGRGEGLGYRGTAVDTACAWWMPEGTSISEDILYAELAVSCLSQINEIGVEAYRADVDNGR